jgi:hypothetical protein
MLFFSFCLFFTFNPHYSSHNDSLLYLHSLYTGNPLPSSPATVTATPL